MADRSSPNCKCLQKQPEAVKSARQLNLLEKQILLDTLLRAQGIKKKAAAMLGIDPRNMPYLLRKHRLVRHPL